MKKVIRTIVYLIITVLIYYISFFSSPYIAAALSTVWIMFIIVNYGLWGGLTYTMVMAVLTVLNYFINANHNIVLVSIGMVTYLCMSIGIGIPIDIIKREHASRIASEAHIRRITDNMQDVIIQIDSKGFIKYISPSCSRTLGHNTDFYMGNSFYMGIHPDDCQTVCSMIENAFTSKNCSRMEYRYQKNNGSYIWMESLGEVILDDKSNSGEIVLCCREITERKESEERIHYLLFHDTLTGLYNRRYFEEELNNLLQKNVLPLSIIIGDVNCLKLTNDVFGHHQGDRLLCKAADLFKAACSNDATIARWGGDEYAVILPGADEQKTEKIVREIDNCCNIQVNDMVKLSIALGSATRNSDKEDIKDIINRAEEKMYRHKLQESRNVRNNIIASLEKTLFEKDYESKRHADRMMQLAHRLGAEIGLSESEQDDLKLLALLHDIGKIAIKENVLLKPGKLTEQEWDEVKKHTEIGYRIAQSTPELCHIADYILSHHERWDGSGYPQGLKGGSIPKLSRILAIIDAFDVMTHQRVYQDTKSSDEAINELKRCSGTQFDPELAYKFINMLGRTA